MAFWLVFHFQYLLKIPRTDVIIRIFAFLKRNVCGTCNCDTCDIFTKMLRGIIDCIFKMNSSLRMSNFKVLKIITTFSEGIFPSFNNF